jgi:hypothetical protein
MCGMGIAILKNTSLRCWQGQDLLASPENRGARQEFLFLIRVATDRIMLAMLEKATALVMSGKWFREI